jgi:hypothetical protein
MPAPNRNVIVPASASYTYVHYPNVGSPSSGGPIALGSATGFQDYYQVASTTTPGFRRIKKRNLPFRAYSKETKWLNDSNGTFVQKAQTSTGYDVSTYTANGAFLGLNVSRISWPTTEADDPSQKSISKLIEQCKQGVAQSGVALAEANKTAAHLAHTASRIYNSLKALKKGRLGEFTSALGITVTQKKISKFQKKLTSTLGGKFNGNTWIPPKVPLPQRYEHETRFSTFMSKTWLEYTYGWKPLLRDVFEHAEALAKIMVETQNCVRIARGRATTEKQSRFSQFINQIRYDHVVSSRMYCEHIVEYSIPNSVADPTTVFGLNNPLAVAWELVPFSFVADWFLPIGSALENLTAYQGLSFRRGVKSIRHVYLHQGTVNAGNAYSSGGVTYTVLSSDVKAEFLNVGIARTVLTSFPTFGWPQFKDPRSFSHAASGIALLQSLFLSGDSQGRSTGRNFSYR